ncbi:MAG TPA: hypothetical protein VLM76_08415, partial [Patescibacteria group bacterium]|nr:hypothetical protein [Patescibacteria group bacterium]
MAILTLQRRLRELGRIRTGVKVAGSNGKSRPAKLETFRLTSASRDLLEAAAAIYDGEVRAWPDGDGWELVTAVDALDIVIPPGNSMTQFYELWSGGGCQRRCDGVTELLTMEPCVCPADQDERRTLAADGRACKPTTRLNVILPLVPDMGVWRLESHGYYAAVELAGTADFLARATAEGRLIPARLRLDQREAKRPNQPIMRYAVPVIELPQTRIAEFMPTLNAAPEVPALAPGQPVRALPAGAPAEPRRQSTRRQRVERPAPGATTPDLPADTRMERPVASFGNAPTFGGWPVEDAPHDRPSPAEVAGRDAKPEDVIIAPSAPTVPAAGLSASALASLARQASRTKGQLAVAIGAVTGTVPGVTDLTDALAAMTDEQRGKLADELGLDW